MSAYTRGSNPLKDFLRQVKEAHEKVGVSASEPYPEVEHIYCTSFCNQGHRMSDGKPINHECYILNPAALEAEREDDYEKAQELLWKKGRRVHPGLKRET
jgi:hypothetical protein